MADQHKQKTEKTKTIVAVFNNQPRTDATVLFCDATQDPERLAKVSGRPVEDITPKGRIEIQKPAVQIAIDITRRASEKTVKGLLRAVMASKPDRKRVGVICHSPHVPFVKNLGDPFAERVVTVTYFGSGEDRSSNAWYRRCDLIVVLGTPRVPPHALKVDLFRIGEVEAARREPKWGQFRWRGRTESGQDIVVDGLGYPHDKEWQNAHRDLVRAGIVQAVGRGRGIMANGCEVVVLSTDECGLPLADNQTLEPMTDSEVAVLLKLAELTEQFPNKSSIKKQFRYPNNSSHVTFNTPVDSKGESSSVTSLEIASTLNLSDRQVRKYLNRLESRQLALRLGERSGWLFSDTEIGCPR